MDPADFDRLVARARDPRLIPGIYNYCDGHCPRCPFSERCLTYLDDRDREAARADVPVADIVRESLERTRDLIVEVARREGVDLPALEDAGAGDRAGGEAGRHPDVVRAREYGALAWRIAQALRPIVALRGDAAVIDAVDAIEWFSTLISAKLQRALAGHADGCEDRGAVQTDFNGSAKVALMGVDESIASWRVLMAAGKATADGVPAQAVKMLDAIRDRIRARFPNAQKFIRPGFDEPAGTGR